ncbi:hypothetical protein CRENBAI_007558 [Crenichthys baileyi]|uniref:Uncharacterized protein n=1 Tax=Crenichthys baileyi TaxID=28760 RepID=A0AAV9SRM3_9TELE
MGVCEWEFVTCRCKFVSVVRTVEGPQSTAPKSSKGQVDPGPKGRSSPTQPDTKHHPTEVGRQRGTGATASRPKRHSVPPSRHSHTDNPSCAGQTRELIPPLVQAPANPRQQYCPAQSR